MVLVAALILSSCTDMYDQPKHKPLEKSNFYADGLSARPLVEGTVARGNARTEELLYTGKAGGRFVDMFPFQVTAEVMERGEDRFNTFCSPCHGRMGDGTGMIVQRGFPKPNSFHSDSVRAKPAGFYFDVMTNGFGRMYSYAPSIPVYDRWAIVAYVRALQLSQRVPLEDLPEAEQQTVMGSAQ